MNRLRNIVDAIISRDRYCIALIAAVVFIFFLPTLVNPTLLIWPHSGLGSDITYRHWPDLIRYAASWSEGRVAIWDSSIALGRPLAGDPTVLFLYPFDIVFAWLPPTFAFNLLDAVHVFIAGLWTFLLMRRGFNVTRAAALISAFAFAFSPKYISHLAGGHVGLIWGVAWAPAVLLGLKLAIDGKLYGALLAGFALAIQLPTHLQMPYYTAVLASAFWAWEFVTFIVTAIRNHQWGWKRIGYLVVVYIVWIVSFILLAAIVLFPLLELLPYNSRGSFTVEDASLYALPPFLLVTMLVPTNFQFPEWTMFIGVVAPVFAIAGGFGKRHRTLWIFFALFTIFALLYALGTSTPLFDAAFHWVPGFNMLRVPTRLWFLGGLAIAILAGLGADYIFTNPELRTRFLVYKRWLLLAVVIYFGGSVIALFGYWGVIGRLHEPMLLRLVTAVLFFGVGYLWYRRKFADTVFQWAMIAIILFDLLPLDAAHIDLVDPTAEFIRANPVVKYLDKQDGFFRVYSPAGDFPYAVAAERKIDTLEGLLAFQIGPAVDAIRTATGCTRQNYATAIPPCLTDLGATASPHPDLLGSLNVRYIVSPQPLIDNNLSLVLSEPKFLYENLAWQPRARLETGGEAMIVNYSEGEYEISVNAKTATTLIVAETWLPGWTATVNNAEQVTYPVDDAIIGVDVSAGQSLIKLSYQPLGWQIGWRTTLISFILLLIGTIFLWIKNIRRSTTLPA